MKITFVHIYIFCGKSQAERIFNVYMKSKYWMAFFVKTFLAWFGTKGNNIYRFVYSMLNTISSNLPIFETSCLIQWKYGFNSEFKCHRFECGCCGGVIKSKRCNSFKSAHLLVTSMHLHMGLKIPSNNCVSNICEMNSPEYIRPCCMLTGKVYEIFQRCLITDQNS